MKGLAVHILPSEGLIFPDEITVGIAVFRKGRRTGIEIVIILAEGFPYRQVGVAVK